MTLRRLTVRTVPVAVALCIAVAPLRLAEAAPDDFRVLEGVLTQSLILPDSEVAEVAGRDGVLYSVDVRLLPRDPVHLPPQTFVIVIGFEGEQPTQIAAEMLKFERGVPEPSDDRRPADLRLIEGTVQAISGQSLTLRSGGGTSVSVDIGSLLGASSSLLSRGERVEVLGVLGDDDTFAANALIFQAPRRRGDGRR